MSLNKVTSKKHGVLKHNFGGDTSHHITDQSISGSAFFVRHIKLRPVKNRYKFPTARHNLCFNHNKLSNIEKFDISNQ